MISADNEDYIKAAQVQTQVQTMINVNADIIQQLNMIGDKANRFFLMYDKAYYKI